MNLESLFSYETTYTKEELLKDMDDLLFFQSFIWVNDLDISSGDYFKLDYKGNVIKGSDLEVDYEKLLKAKVFSVTENENLELYKAQEKKYIIYLQKIENALNLIVNKVENNFINGLIHFLLLEHQRKTLFEVWDVDFSIWRKWANYRINAAFDELWDWKIGVFFTIRKLKKIPFTIQEMWVTETMLKNFNLPSWLILISGPTWSAKSSTLNSILDYYNKNKYLKIITLEDPVEFFWSSLQNKCTFRQREIWKTAESFASGIRAWMRQSPHVIVVWELRDKETVNAAIEASTTWHLVIATIHVDSVVQVLDRVLWFFKWSERETIALKLSSSLKFVLNQRLVTTQEEEYKVAYEWLSTTQDWIASLIKTNNLQDIRKRMYELDSNWKTPHKPLNESLFELVCDWKVAYSRAKTGYSNDLKSFDNEFEVFRSKYCEVNKMSSRELQERLTYVEKLYQKKLEQKLNKI